MNYVQLRAAIQQYAEDFEASFVDNVDTFIQLAESRILLRVKLPKYRKDSDGTLAGQQRELALPSDFLSPDSLILEDTERLIPLINKDPEFIAECYPDLTYRNEPRFYSMLNERTIIVGPTPPFDYIAHLGYFYDPPSIVTSGNTWLGDHFAHSLLSGSLLEAAKYQKSEDSQFLRFSDAFDKDVEMDADKYAKSRAKKDTYQEPDERVKV
jgi:hypothetical protein